MVEEVVKAFLRKIGAKGGKTTSKKYGKEHYTKLAENMNAKRKAKKNTVLSESLNQDIDF